MTLTMREKAERLLQYAGDLPSDHYVRIRDVARAYLEGMTWRPIETAPKDGTPILVAVAHAGGEPRLVVGEAYWHYSDKFYWAQEEPGDWPEADPIHPTHWLPLPAPPALGLQPTNAKEKQ